MRWPRRRAAVPEGDGPESDAERQAAWDASAVATVHPRRKAVLVLGLAALLVVAVLVVARARGDGDILALGSSPKSSTTTLAPLADGPIAGDPLFEGSQVIAPGDPSVPGAGAAPAAGGAATDPAAVAAAAGQTGTGGAAGTPGDGSGAAGAGIPTPTTGPGSTGGGGATTTIPGPAASTTTTIPGQPPPPPSCRVTEAVAKPAGAGAKGQSGKLDIDSIRVEFRQTSCGSGFRAQVNGKNEPANAGGDGLHVANIPTSGTTWNPNTTYPISIKNGAGLTIATIQFRVS